MNNLVLLPQVAQTPEHRVCDFAEILLLDLPCLLDHKVQTATVHKLHADMDLPVAVNVDFTVMF